MIMITGIIAEYNPFHLGHAYHVEAARATGAECIVAVMSGSFTQRAESAICPKRARVLAALECGVDIVLELPVAAAAGNAESFARAGVRILDAFGADTLCFGSETGDTRALQAISELLDDGAFETALRENLASGKTFATARAGAADSIMPGAASVLRGANDTLGIEYIRAISALNSDMRPIAVKRSGALHDGKSPAGGIASASFIRAAVRGNIDKIIAGDSSPFAPYMPVKSAEILLDEIRNKRAPSDMDSIGTAILAALRRMSAEDIARAPDVSEGIENRIYFAARQARTLDELYSLAKTKRYSHARIRRIVLHSFLGVDAADAKAQPEYIRVLGFNKVGREFLSRAAKKSAIPIVTGVGQIRALGEAARRRFALECAASDVYALSLPSPLPCGEEERYGVISL